MYRLGWHERNGGNISIILDDADTGGFKRATRVFPIGFDASELSGKHILITSSGSYFKNIETNQTENLGIVRISKDGKKAELVWGFVNGGMPTSEFPTHLMCHIERLKKNPTNKVIIHSHPTHTLAMNAVHKLESREFTRSLWKACSECIVIFPDGVGVLPWMVCGTNEIGAETAEMMKQHRIVMWGMHGIYACGKNLDEAFGLIETVEKAAQLYMISSHLPKINTITDKQLKQLAEHFNVDYRKDFI